MSVWTNAQLIYGFISRDKAVDLFASLTEKWEETNDDGETYALEEMHAELQEKHGVSLRSIADADVDILYAYEASASGRNFDSETIKAEDMAKTEEYASNIKQFLEALGIDASQYQPGWHILAYMD